VNKICNPANQMSIAPKKAKSFSEVKKFCNDKCLYLHLQSKEKEVHLQLGKDSDEYSKTSN
jgi:hypothetical protein